MTVVHHQTPSPGPGQTEAQNTPCDPCLELSVSVFFTKLLLTLRLRVGNDNDDDGDDDERLQPQTITINSGMNKEVRYAM